jgi:hypothetical protein
MLDEATLDISGTFAGEAIRFLTLFVAQHEAEHRGGAARSRDEGSLMELDRRGCVLCVKTTVVTEQIVETAEISVMSG